MLFVVKLTTKYAVCSQVTIYFMYKYKVYFSFSLEDLSQALYMQFFT